MNFFATQVNIILHKKATQLVFAIMLFCVLYHYFQNVDTYEGYDLAQMYHPMKLVMLDGQGGIDYQLLQIFPILVVLTGGWAYFDDVKCGYDNYWIARIGKRQYFLGKYIAVFAASFLVFTIPLVLELILYMLAFPLDATGDPFATNLYDASFLESEKRYLFYPVYHYSPILYAFFRAVLFGIVSGILSGFTVAVSFIVKVPFRVLLFFPVYLIIYSTYYIGDYMEFPCQTYYFWYLMYHNVSVKSEYGFIGFLTVLLVVSLLFLFIRRRKDVLS